MEVWDYATIPGKIEMHFVNKTTCPFCNLLLKKDFLTEGEVLLTVKHCLQCGWWTASHYVKAGVHHKFKEDYVSVRDAYGILKELDLSNIDIPISEIIKYLTVKFDKITQVSPRKFEEVVGSVFSNLGYRAVVTNYSGDNGIDVILHDSSSNMIGVQVKKYNNKIEAAQIRELTGSLKLGDYTKGIFVTTSDFTKGAKETSQLSTTKGIPIELMNAAEFYDALKLSQISVNRQITWETYDIKKFKPYHIQCLGDLDFEKGEFYETPSYDSE